MGHREPCFWVGLPRIVLRKTSLSLPSLAEGAQSADKPPVPSRPSQQPCEAGFEPHFSSETL